MKAGVLRFVVAALVIGLNACATTPPPAQPAAPASTTPTTPEVKPSAPSTTVETRTPESTKPITPEMARNLANNCFTCHGPAGKSPGAMPSLTHYNAADMTARLKRYKRGEDPSTIMGRQVRGYSDAELEAVASYIAGLKK